MKFFKFLQQKSFPSDWLYTTHHQTLCTMLVLRKHKMLANTCQQISAHHIIAVSCFLLLDIGIFFVYWQFPWCLDKSSKLSDFNWCSCNAKDLKWWHFIYSAWNRRGISLNFRRICLDFFLCWINKEIVEIVWPSSLWFFFFDAFAANLLSTNILCLVFEAMILSFDVSAWLRIK